MGISTDAVIAVVPSKRKVGLSQGSITRTWSIGIDAAVPEQLANAAHREPVTLNRKSSGRSLLSQLIAAQAIAMLKTRCMVVDPSGFASNCTPRQTAAR
jgi:hypothetical protein